MGASVTVRTMYSGGQQHIACQQSTAIGSHNTVLPVLSLIVIRRAPGRLRTEPNLTPQDFNNA